MYRLSFWHNVSDYSEWKKLFDSDPLGRERSGVRRYRLTRPVDDQHLVVGDLEFDTLRDAETFAERLREMWKGVDEHVMTDADLTITEIVESKDYLVRQQRVA